MNLEPVLIRTEVIKAIRKFFTQRDLVELFPPVLLTSLPLESAIFAFETTWHRFDGQEQLFMAISPESSLKKMVAAGVGECFAIGKSFRNLEGSGEHHNPEFMMLEWYRLEATYDNIMHETQELFIAVKKDIDAYHNQTFDPNLSFNGLTICLTEKWPKLSLADLFEAHANLKIENILDDNSMKAVATQKGYSIDGATWDDLFDQIFLNEVEPHLPKTAFFLTDFPSRLSPLCRPRADKPYLAERFEVYVGGMELGNGNTENLDAKQIKKAFDEAVKDRKKRGKSAPPIDTELLKALTTLAGKYHSLAGIGLGVDRLAMLMANTTQIGDVEPLLTSQQK